MLVGTKGKLEVPGMRGYLGTLVELTSVCLLASLETKKTELVRQVETRGTMVKKPFASEGFLQGFSRVCDLIAKSPELAVTNSLDCVLLVENLFGILSSSDDEVLIDRAVCEIKTVTMFRPETYAEAKKRLPVTKVLLSGMVERGSAKVREIFQQLTCFLAANICWPVPLHDFILGMLSTSSILTKDSGSCAELVEALGIMIDLMQEEQPAPKEMVASCRERLEELLRAFYAYSSKEKFGAPNEVDDRLNGMLKLVGKLVSAPEVARELNNRERIALIQEVFFTGLFPLKSSIESVYEFKCKTARSRETAFKLISAAMENKGECIEYLIKDCVVPLGSQIAEQLSWGYEPEKQEKSQSGFVGIKNLGAICYMNAMLQQFFMLSPFRNAIFSVDDKRLPVYSNPLGIDDNMLHQIQTIFGYLTFSSRRDVNPSNFCFAFKEHDGKPTNTSIQHDAHEFLNILFDRLELAFKDTPYNQLLQHVFAGKSCSQVRCQSCGNVSATFEDYYTLSLEIKNQKTLYDALEKYIAGATVSDYYCQSCKKRGEVVKRILLSRLPNVLIVHLQRFTYNFDTSSNEKANPCNNRSRSIQNWNFRMCWICCHTQKKEWKTRPVVVLPPLSQRRR